MVRFFINQTRINYYYTGQVSVKINTRSLWPFHNQENYMGPGNTWMNHCYQMDTAMEWFLILLITIY